MGYPTRQSTRQLFHVEPNLYHAWLCLLNGQISFVIWILKSKMLIHLKVVQSGAHGKFRRDCCRDFTWDDCSTVKQWKIVVTSFHLTLLLICPVTWPPNFHGVEDTCERIEAGSQLQHVSSLLSSMHALPFLGFFSICLSFQSFWLLCVHLLNDREAKPNYSLCLLSASTFKLFVYIQTNTLPNYYLLKLPYRLRATS